MTAICVSLLLATANGAVCPESVDIESLPVLLTWYDPAQCVNEFGAVIVNINCNHDPFHFADGTAVLESSYGTTAACIPEWLGRDITVIGLGTYRCRDTGGGIVVEWNEYYQQWVIRLDVLSHDPIDRNYCLWEWVME